MQELWLQLIWNSVFFALFLAAAAASFSLIFNVTKVLHIAHGAIMLAAGYIFWSLGSAGIGFVWSFALAAGAAAALGGLMHVLVYEPMRRRRCQNLMAALIASLALLVILTNAVLGIWGSLTRRVPTPFDNLETIVIYGVRVSPLSVAVAAVSVILLALLGVILKRTKLGTSMRAVSDNEEAAEVVGINSARVRLYAFVIGSAVAGVMGVFGALLFQLEPNKSIFYALESFSRAIVGGLGSVLGAIIASFLVQFVQNIGGFLWLPAFQDFFSFAAAFAFLLIRPQGIFGKKLF